MLGLIEVLASKPQGDRLCHQLNQIKKAATPLLAKITETFPEYTIHDIRHSEEVVVILDWLVPDNLKQFLNAYELYFLIMSAYLHDIGMVDFPELLDEDFTTRTKRKSPGITDEEVKRMYIRENHQLRSEQFIEKHFRELSIEDFFQAKIVGRICRGHRNANLSNRQLFNNREMYSAKNIPINIPLLSALLQIADELDLTFERCPIIIYETIKPHDPINRLEWERHLSTCGVGLNPENSQQIIVTAPCWNPKIYRELKRLETRIQAYLTALPDYLFQYREFRDSLPYTIYVDIEAIGFKTLDFKFSLQEDQIVSLLMGEKLYERKEDCLRELIQNSIDACRRRLFLKENYQPKIVFELSPERDKIIVSDNGMGMDEYTIENYFTKIGRCFYTSPEFLEEDATFTPASQFGIGIVSCFMLANTIIIETKTDHSSPLRMEIDGLSDYFFVTDGKRKESGTAVTLILKEKLGEDFDLVREIRRYTRHTFPVKVITPDGESIVEDKGYDLDVKLLWGIHLKDSRFFNRYTSVQIPINEETVKGRLGLIFEKDEQLGVKPASRWGYTQYYPQYRYYSPRNKIFVSNEGIFVNDVPDLAPEWLDQGLLGEINLSGFRLDLNIPRNNVVRNEKFKELRRFLENKILDKIDEIFQRIQPRSVNQERDNLFARFFQKYVEATEYVHGERRVKDLPEKLIGIIQRSYFLECLSNGSRVYRTWNDLLKEDKPITILHGYFPENATYVAEIITNCSSMNWNEFYIFTRRDADAIDCIIDWKKKHGEEIQPLVQKRNVHNTIKYVVNKSVKDLQIFPVTWNIVKYTNYQSTRFTEEVGWFSAVLVNIEHRFVNLLVKNKNIINTAGRKQIVLSFFRQLKRKVADRKFQKIQKEQRKILQWFKDADIIENVNDYLLTEKDFPPQ